MANVGLNNLETIVQSLYILTQNLKFSQIVTLFTLMRFNNNVVIFSDAQPNIKKLYCVDVHRHIICKNLCPTCFLLLLSEDKLITSINHTFQ